MPSTRRPQPYTVTFTGPKQIEPVTYVVMAVSMKAAVPKAIAFAAADEDWGPKPEVEISHGFPNTYRGVPDARERPFVDRRPADEPDRKLLRPRDSPGGSDPSHRHFRDIKQLPIGDANGHGLISARGGLLVIWPLEGGDPHISLIDPCGLCGERPKLYVADDTVRAQDACPYAEGITTRVTLRVPSGKLVITDDLRPLYTWDRDSFDYNASIGKARVIETMAAQGCAYGPVGNTCPSLYRTGPDTYVIASVDEDDPCLPDSSRLATVCTDLWAYSCADLDDFLARGGDRAELDRYADIVEIEPGEYRFTHHTNELDFDYDAAGTIIYAHIERIG